MIPLVYVLCAILIFLVYIYCKSKALHLPPGPSGIPIFGYLPWIDSKRPYVSLTNLARKYGPICGLQMGSVYTILLSDPQLVRQALAKDEFAGRAPLYLTHGIMQGYGLIGAEGERWKDQRKFVATCLKNFGVLKIPSVKRNKIEKMILLAVKECISKLQGLARNGADPMEALHHCVGNLLNDLVFGKVYHNNDEEWKWLRHLQEEGVKHIGVAGLLNFFPFLRFLPRYGKIMSSLIEGKQKTHRIYQTIIDEHHARPTLKESFLKVFDYVMMSNQENPGHFTKQQFYHLLADLFGAGTDTTLTTLRWFLLFMATHPDEQKKIQEEMKDLLGLNQPKLENRNILIRLQAAIAETQRLRSVTPLGIPHGTLQDTQLNGYDIPKGTMIIPLQWAIHTDPSYWDDPLSFQPKRFIGVDGSLLKPIAFMPYQTGKRMCVGDELAKMMLFLFAGAILYSFDISLSPNTQVDLEGECGITLVPKPHPLIFKWK